MMRMFLMLVMVIIGAIGVISMFQQGWVNTMIMVALLSFAIGYMLSQRERKEEY